MEAPPQRHRGVDEIADQKIDLLTVNWMLFQQVEADARNGVSTTLFNVSKIQ